MNSKAPSGPSASALEKKQEAQEILDKLDVEERIRDRKKAPNLSLTLTPMWVWCLGLLYLPKGMPTFALAMFHATCWAGFLWFAWKTWQAYQDERMIGNAAEKAKRREDFLKAVKRRQKP